MYLRQELSSSNVHANLGLRSDGGESGRTRVVVAVADEEREGAEGCTTDGERDRRPDRVGHFLQGGADARPSPFDRCVLPRGWPMVVRQGSRGLPARNVDPHVPRTARARAPRQGCSARVFNRAMIAGGSSPPGVNH